MPRKRHTPEQIIGKLREAEVGLTTSCSLEMRVTVRPSPIRRHSTLGYKSPVQFEMAGRE